MSDQKRRTWGRGWGKPGKGPRSGERKARGRRRPELDALEDRTLLSGVPVGVNQGDFYLYGEQPVSLNLATDQLLVKLDAGRSREVLEPLTQPGGLFAGSEISRVNNSGLWTIDLAQPVAAGDLAGLVGQLEAVEGVTYASETFYETVGNTRLLVTTDIVVGLKPGVDPAAVFGGAEFAGYRNVGGTNDQFVVTTTAEPGRATMELGNQLNSDGRVSFSSADFVFTLTRMAAPNDPLFAQQWHLNNTGQQGAKVGADARVQGAWDLGITGNGVVIAIVDDSVQLNHPDLQANLWVNTGEISGNGIDDDGNGWVDDINGWDFIDNDNDPSPASASDNHGTAVAGIAAAVGNNGLGVAGAAYQSKIMAVRLVGAALPVSAFAEAVYYLSGRTRDGSGTWKAADVGNHSYGGYGPLTVVEQAFDWSANFGREGKGVPNFAASGNGADIPSQAAAATYPSGFSSVIAVGGSTDGDVRVTYSQYGPNLSFLASTGGLGWNGRMNTVTTDRVGGNGYDPSDYTGTGATGFNGTSSASPLAAGVGALLLQADPTLTWAQVRDVMRNTADKIGPLPYVNGRNQEYGYGRINAAAAVSQVLSQVDLTLPTNLTENQAYTNVVVGRLTFASSTPPSAVVEYTATVDLDNGLPPVPANLVARPGGSFDIVVPTLNYREAGIYQVKVTVSRAGTAVVTKTGPLTIIDLPIIASAGSLILNEGVAYSGAVGTFQDTDPDPISPSAYTVLIAWGDGTTSPGVVSSLGNNMFQVAGQHTYGGGDYVMTMTVTGPGGGKATATAPVIVGNSILTVTPRTVTPIEGQAFAGTIASFVDSDPRVIPATYYRTTIDWGDGPYASQEVGKPIPDFISQANPLISNLRLNVGQFPIADLNVNLTIRHDRPGDLTVFLIGPDGTRVRLFSGLTKAGRNLVGTTFDDEASVGISAGSPSYTGSFRPSQSLSVFDGKELSGTWQLELTDSQAGFIGTLESWSLSALEQGRLSMRAGGGFDVRGNHIFQVGTYGVTVRVQDGDVSDETVVTTAVVSNAPITTSPGRVNVVEGTEFNGLVAYFFDSNVNAVASAFAATIEWGDGTSSPGLVTPDGGGQFVVTGKHAYAAPGQYQMLVTLSEQNFNGDPVTPQVTQAVTANVSNANLSPETTSFTAVEGQTLNNVTVARFRDGNALANPADYTVNVDWGNGEASGGMVRAVPNQPGLFEVMSTYAYPRAGNYSAIVNVLDNAGVPLTMITGAKVDDAALAGLLPPGGLIIPGTEQMNTGLVVLGYFMDTNSLQTDVSQFAASVDWGDGTTGSAQLIYTGGGHYQVVGSHVFPVSGTFMVQTTVQSVDGASVLLSTQAVMSDLILPLSGQLEAGSDTGASASDGITSQQTMSFAGQGDRLSTITLYAEPLAGGPRVVIGATTSDSQGNWRLTVGPMAPGSYRIMGLATDSAGRPGSVLTEFYNAAQPLVVDTVGPVVQSTQYDSRRRSFRVTYRDAESGVGGSGMLNAANYVLNQANGQLLTASSVSGVAGDPNTVLVQFRSIPRGRSVLMINTVGVSDLAGNALGKGQPNAAIVNLSPGVPYYSAYELNNGSNGAIRTSGSPAGPREFVARGIWRNRRPPLRG